MQFEPTVPSELEFRLEGEMSHIRVGETSCCCLIFMSTVLKVTIEVLTPKLMEFAQDLWEVTEP